MLLLVGLGNPGPEYERSRHNVGFMAVDAIADRYGFPAYRSRFQGLISDAMIGTEKVMILKPMTYMNLSGQAVGEACRYYKLAATDMLVLHDEIDLAFGKLKVKRGGGNAGHNGLRSIDAHLGSADYRRVRIGVGHPGGKDRVTSHVLSSFSKADLAFVETWLRAIADNVPHLVAGDDARFVNDVALAMAADDKSERNAARRAKDEPGPAEKSTRADSAHADKASETPAKSGLAAAFEAALARLRGET